MSELTMLIDTTNGVMFLEHSHLSASVLNKVTAIAGEGKECGCARPIEVIPVPITPTRPVRIPDAAAMARSATVARSTIPAVVCRTSRCSPAATTAATAMNSSRYSG